MNVKTKSEPGESARRSLRRAKRDRGKALKFDRPCHSPESLLK